MKSARPEEHHKKNFLKFLNFFNKRLDKQKKICYYIDVERQKQKFLKGGFIMKVYSEISISNFDAWQGAIATKELIIKHNKEDEFDTLIEELYPDGIDETKLNDILWFDDEWVLESLGITEEEEENEEEFDEVE